VRGFVKCEESRFKVNPHEPRVSGKMRQDTRT
jgi:hypothetical protein